MRIMTSNIWGCYFGNPAAERIDAIEATLKRYDADVIGIQEMCPRWYENDLAGRMKDRYTFVSGFIGNHSPLFFKKDIFDIVETGWMRYAKAFDVSKSVTWAVLETKDQHKKIAVFNTHMFWNNKVSDEDERRESNAMELLEKMRSMKEKYGNIPTVAFGDFNSTADGLAMKYLNANNVFSAYELADVWSEVSSHHGNPVRGEDGKYLGTKTTNDKTQSIDHVVFFKDELKVKEQRVVEDQDILNATDHSPVYVDFEF